MSSIVFESSITGLAEVLRVLDVKAIQAGLGRGITKVGESVKSKASGVIRESYNLKRVDVDNKFQVISAQDEVLIVCRSRPINLTEFGAVQLGTRAGKRLTIKRKGNNINSSVRGKAGLFGGVTVPIEKDHTTLLSGAFIAKVKAGKKGAFNIGVFSRTNHAAAKAYRDPRNRRKTNRPYVKVARALTAAPRKAIINRAFVSVSTLFLGKRVLPVIDEYLSNDALKVVMHEIDWATRGDK